MPCILHLIAYLQIVAVLNALSLLSAGAAQGAERKLADLQPFSAFAPAGFACGKEVTVTVRAPEEAVFARNRVELQKLIGGLRAILGFECPNATISNLVVVGEAGGRQVYRGSATASDDWRLTDIRTSPAVSPAPASPVAAARGEHFNSQTVVPFYIEWKNKLIEYVVQNVPEWLNYGMYAIYYAVLAFLLGRLGFLIKKGLDAKEELVDMQDFARRGHEEIDSGTRLQHEGIFMYCRWYCRFVIYICVACIHFYADMAINTTCIFRSYHSHIRIF